MKNIIAYNSVYYFDRQYSEEFPKIRHLNDVRIFGGMFYLFARNMSVIDRTNTIDIPLNVHKLDNCKMPEYIKFDKSLNDISESRARYLMDHALSTNRKIAVMWSGGVDSTLILVSLLKTCTTKELQENVVVLLSQDSIIENPKFYTTYVLKNFTLIPSNNFSNYIGNDSYFYVTGEGNDQLCASLFVIEAYKLFYNDNNIAFETLDIEKMIHFISKKTSFNEPDSSKLFNVLNKVVQVCPFKIDTAYKFFWWINFSMKWQNTYIRSTLYAKSKNRESLKPEENYTTFFHNDEFQLWSMNVIDNNGSFVKDTSASSYKKDCKQIIYDFDKNDDYYLNKGKTGSFARVVQSKDTVNFVTSDMQFYPHIDFMEVYNPNNSFV